MANETTMMIVNVLRIVPLREEVLLQLHQGLQGAADGDGKFKYTFFYRKGFSQELRIDLLFRPDTAGPGRPEVNTGVGGKASNNDK